MNKLDTLRSYLQNPDVREGWTMVVAAWKSQGSFVIKPETSYYAEGLIYRLSASLTSDPLLKGGLLYCKREYVGTLSWKNAKCPSPTTGNIFFQQDIISPNFVLILPSDAYNEVRDAAIPDGFIPFALQAVTAVSIPEKDYALCLRDIGYPFITEDELEYTREQINDLAIKPALDEYFKWFPKVRIETCTLGSSAIKKLPFPPDAYDIVHFDVQQAGSNVTSGEAQNTLWRGIQESFYGIMSTSNMTGTYYGGFGQAHTNLSLPGSFLTQRATTQGMLNYTTRTDFQKYQEEDGTWWVKFYSTKGGVAEVHWALQSYTFEDVEFAQRNNLLKLCTAYVKRLFGNLRRQVNTNIPGVYDYNKWVEEANAAEDTVIKEWQSIVKSAGAVLRGSL